MKTFNRFDRSFDHRFDRGPEVKRARERAAFLNESRHKHDNSDNGAGSKESLSRTWAHVRRGDGGIPQPWYRKLQRRRMDP